MVHAILTMPQITGQLSLRL